MDIWEVVKFVSGILGGLATIAIMVIGYFLKQLMQDLTEKLKLESHKREIEFGSIKGRMETMSDEREAGDSRLHERLNDMEQRLPREYARTGDVKDLRRRMEGMEHKMELGFDRLAGLINNRRAG
jgi:predicted nuclease with TOPRIM domain